MDYGTTFKRAWQTTWNHKILWVFGLLASLGAGGSSANYTGSSRYNFNFSQGSNGEMPQQFEKFVEQMSTVGEQYGVQIFTIAVIAFVIGLIFSILFLVARTFGKASLIRGTMELESNDTFQPSLQSVGSLGRESFLPLLRLNFAYGVVVFFLFGLPILLGIFIGAAINPIFIMLIFCAFCIIGPLMLVANVIVGLANYTLVIESLSMVDAIKRSWAVLKSDFANLFAPWLYLAFIQFAVGLVLLIPTFIVMGPIIASGFIGGAEALGRTALLLVLGGLCLWPLGAFVNSVVQTYVNTLWTMIYLEITADPFTNADEPAVIPATN